MNEMIIEGKFINIKEDIAILNDEVDNYIENVLSTKDAKDYEFLIREYVDAFFAYNEMLNAKEEALENVASIKIDIELAKSACKLEPSDMYENLKEEITKARGIIGVCLLSELAMIDPIAVLNTTVLLFNAYVISTAYNTSNYKKNKERERIKFLLQELKTNFFAIKYIDSFTKVWQRKISAIYEKLSLIESLPDNLVIDDYILVRKKDKND